MRLAFRLFAVLALLCFPAGAAWAEEPVTSLVFSGNTWGYFNPCPT